jgi:hypothetical protein
MDGRTTPAILTSEPHRDNSPSDQGPVTTRPSTDNNPLNRKKFLRHVAQHTGVRH